MPPGTTLLDAPAPSREQATAPATRRIGLHVAGLALLLLALVPLLGRAGLFSADEGAAAAQTRLLSEDRGWALAHPLPALDPEGTAFPLEKSSILDRDGQPAAAPFAKHPAYPILLAPFDGLGGIGAMTLTSVLGTVLAAALAGLLARRLVPGWEPVAVWATGLATPLFVDSWLLIAHTLGAGLVAVAALAVVRADEGRGGPALVTAAAAMAAAVLLRNEATLFGIALALAAVAVGLHHRRRAFVLGGVAAAVGTVGGFALDAALSAAVGGDAETTFRAGLAGSGFLAGRVSGAVLTLVTPSYGAFGPGDMALVVAVMALVGMVVVARRRPEDTDGVRVFAAVAVAAVVVRAVAAPEVVPGLLLAAPALTGALAAVTRRTVAPPTARLLAGTVLLFTGAVLATQYATGGSGEWGGRYFALALPLVVPLALLGLRDLFQGLPSPAVRPMVAALVVAGVASAVMGGRALRSIEDRTVAIVDTVDEAAATLDDPVVVAVGGAAPRFAWEQVVDGAPWLLVTHDELPAWLDRLHTDGRDVVLATYEADEARTAVTSHTVLSDERATADSTWVVLALEAS